MNKRAVVLLSGGLDSATVLAMAKDEGYETYALTFAYGQRHEIELRAASRVAMSLAATEHRTIEIDLRVFGGSALTDTMPVPKNRPENEMASEIPITYVPARNTIFLSYALAWAEVLDARDIFIGANALDYSGYPDCRSEFIDAFARVANLGTKASTSARPFRLHAPLIAMSKSEIIRRGQELGVPFALTHSCYDPLEDGSACGECDSCQLRRNGFKEAGVPDPTCYAALPAAPAERT